MRLHSANRWRKARTVGGLILATREFSFPTNHPSMAQTQPNCCIGLMYLWKAKAASVRQLGTNKTRPLPMSGSEWLGPRPQRLNINRSFFVSSAQNFTAGSQWSGLLATKVDFWSFSLSFLLLFCFVFVFSTAFTCVCPLFSAGPTNTATDWMFSQCVTRWGVCHSSAFWRRTPCVSFWHNQIPFVRWVREWEPFQSEENRKGTFHMLQRRRQLCRKQVLAWQCVLLLNNLIPNVSMRYM